MVVINGKDTNSQSDRADLRKSGYYIDNSGAYAPGAGARAGDTFSGAQATKNTAPSPTRLPVINGTPVSPSNGSTGPQTGAIMYRSDPQYSQYFGPGTPGYSSTTAAGERGDPTLGATGPVAGQQSLNGFLTAQGTPVDTTGAPVSAPASVPAPARMPGTMDSGQTAAAAPGAPAPAAGGAGAAPADAAFTAGMSQVSANGYGYGPYATSAAPELRVQGRYTENGKVIEKSVDQFGNPYYQTVGSDTSASSAPATTAPGAPDPAAAAVPAQGMAAGGAAAATGARGQAQTTAQTTGTGAPGTAADSTDPTRGGTLSPITVGDQVLYVPNADKQQIQDAVNAASDATRQATQFTQNNQTGQLDINRMVAVSNAAYQKALSDGNSATLAETIARDAMQNDIAKQTLALNTKIQADTAAYQQGQLEQQRSATAQTNSIEQEKLAFSRQTARGRRLPQVRYS